MYEAFYGFDVLPFSNTPNARFFYQSEQHTEALAKLMYTVQSRRGIALITGQIGCGKTMLIRAMMQRLGNHASVALINNTRVTGEQLLRMICSELTPAPGTPATPGSLKLSEAALAGAKAGAKADDLKLPRVAGVAGVAGVPGAEIDKAEILTRIRRFAESEHQQGRTVAIVIDEAQALPVEAFEELRLLTNLETETQKLVQLLILGQPELANVLRHPRLGPLTQRIGMYGHLEPMTEIEMAKYIAFRLIRASQGRPNIDFSTAALKLIYQKSRGIPRMINLIADHALLVGFSSETRFIDSQIVLRAIEKHLPAFEATVVELDDVLTGSQGEITHRTGLEQSPVVTGKDLLADTQAEVAHG